MSGRGIRHHRRLRAGSDGLRHPGPDLSTQPSRRRQIGHPAAGPRGIGRGHHRGYSQGVSAGFEKDLHVSKVVQRKLKLFHRLRDQLLGVSQLVWIVELLVTKPLEGVKLVMLRLDLGEVRSAQWALLLSDLRDVRPRVVYPRALSRSPLREEDDVGLGALGVGAERAAGTAEDG